MKKLLIISTILLSSSLFCNELAWVDEQVEAIKPSRVGMDSSLLTKIHDPFIFLRKPQTQASTSPKIVSVSKPTKVKQVLILSLIVNNTALINDVWYKIGDKVNGYEIKEIDAKSVLLTNKKKQLLLSTKSSSNNLKFNNK